MWHGAFDSVPSAAAKTLSASFIGVSYRRIEHGYDDIRLTECTLRIHSRHSHVLGHYNCFHFPLKLIENRIRFRLRFTRKWAAVDNFVETSANQFRFRWSSTLTFSSSIQTTFSSMPRNSSFYPCLGENCSEFGNYHNLGNSCSAQWQIRLERRRG